KDGTKDEANTSEKERLFDTSKENKKYSNIKKDEENMAEIVKSLKLF
ncbi:9628_t:CDS:1, partial [Racocetra fulgida]